MKKHIGMDKMGYTTNYKGELKFNYDITVSDIRYLQQFLDIDTRCADVTLPNNQFFKDLPAYIDLEITSGFSGLKWTGAEKSYDMVTQVNYIIEIMKAQNPNFKLSGYFDCQGEDKRDVWILQICDDGYAHKQKLERDGIYCPHCDEFIESEYYED